MNELHQQHATGLHKARIELFNARVEESNAWLAYREKYDDAALSDEYQVMVRGKNKVLQVEREAWLNRQCRSEYRLYRETKVRREIAVDRMKEVLALVDLYTEEAF